MSGSQQRLADPKTGRLYRIVRPPQRIGSPPKALRRAQLDNLVLVPASLLPLKGQYQVIANQQPQGTTRVVLPSDDSRPRRTLERFITRLQEKGQPVQIVTSSQARGSAL